ncbi:unnamed protein product [Pseudo-nitzschia multistriata]|uniref:Uncharacterized protein n=1 Tax=Pseudo-nitzschia multistriata TaxID=183589 RepID=A0A448Z4B4_9STRA|nr:unnamed protein product [Pseudo-nitzschia multistriata]
MSGFGGSGFGGGNRNNNRNNNNNSWGGKGGRNNNSWGGHGGGRNSGRGGRHSGRGGRSGGRGGRSGGRGPSGLIKICGFYTKRDDCSRVSCQHAHVIKLHAKIDATGKINNNNNNNNGFSKGGDCHAVTSVAIWETGGNVKIFTGGKDGFWRLWSFNARTNQFDQEFEHQMGGPVETLVVASNYLFCGFDGISKALPEISVGMVHAWNLASPNDPPLEFHMQPNLIPYAHPSAVKKLLVIGQKVISGSVDGSIKLWTFQPPSAEHPKGAFVLTQNLLGHAREISGLVDVGSMLWSCSTDGSIRLWDMAKPGAPCQHFISMSSPASGGNDNSGPGHTNAVTGLEKFKSSAGDFVLSCSLDGTVKAWNGGTGQCVASESHEDGVVSMSMIGDMNGKPCLLLGCESGMMYIRNLEPTAKIQQAFAGLIILHEFVAVVHYGAVKSLCKGPAGTFYTGGEDGKVLVYQITGDLGL